MPPPRRALSRFWRAALLIAGTGGGTLLVAGPMILSEWDASPGPARLRLMIALITALLLLPGVIAGLWHKSMARALAGMFGPAVIAAITAANLADEDYSFLKVGVPVMIVGGLLMALLLPPRRFDRGRGLCHRCGYDLRGTDGPRCSECGTAVDEAAQMQLPRKLQVRWSLIGVAGFAISSALCYSFVDFLLSLG